MGSFRRTAVVVAVLALAAGVAPASGGSAFGLPAEQPGSNGLLIVGPYDPDLRPVSPVQRRSMEAADALVRANPSDFAPVWLNRSTGQVHLAAATPRGSAMGRTAKVASWSGVAVTTDVAGVASQATLVDLMDRLIDVRMSGVSGAESIHLTEVDAELGRAVVTAGTFTKELGGYLAENFPLDLIALRVDATDGADARPADARNADTKPFDGGSQIGLEQPNGSILGCTNGLPWKDGSYWYLLTAGHCAPSGSSRVYTDASGQPKEGTITSSTRENWTNGTGTVKMTGGYTKVAGDFALVQVSSLSNSGVEPYVFRGGPGGSTTKTKVYGWSNSSPVVGDQLCTSGRQTGEMCGWVINRVNYDQSYGVHGVARHISSARKQGKCTIDGDSGAPLHGEQQRCVRARDLVRRRGRRIRQLRGSSRPVRGVLWQPK